MKEVYSYNNIVTRLEKISLSILTALQCKLIHHVRKRWENSSLLFNKLPQLAQYMSTFLHEHKLHLLDS